MRLLSYLLAGLFVCSASAEQLAGPDGERRMPAASCNDVPSWRDSEGYNCSQYRNESWCTVNGTTGHAWMSRWGDLQDYWHDGFSAIAACCACGGGQVTQISGAWEVLRGPCTVAEDCILSPNYPQNYSNNQQCTIIVNDTLAKPLHTVAWDTEYWYDYLNINGKYYSGLQNPDGVIPAGAIQWTSDEDTVGKGWKLCASGSTTPTSTTSSEGTTSTTTDPNSLTSSTGAASSQQAPCRDVEGWTDSAVFSCEDYVTDEWCTSTGGPGPRWGEEWGSPDNFWHNGYSAADACCACGGGQIPSIVGPWQVLRGECTIVDDCILSPNYPGNYSSNQRCTIVTNSSLMSPLRVVDFLTEQSYDVLTINGRRFSGRKRPTAMTPMGTISWRSDDDIEAKGWKLCLGPRLSGGDLFTVLEGRCSVDSNGCALSPNYPEPYGPLEDCVIQVFNPDNKSIVAPDFATETNYDVLWVNGRRFSGSNSPQGEVPTEPIQWSSDEDLQERGWKLCPGPVGQASAGAGQSISAYGYGDDNEDGDGQDEDNGEGDDALTNTETPSGREPAEGSSGTLGPDQASQGGSPELEEETASDINGSDINGGLPFGKLLLAAVCICLAGVLFVRCRRNQDKSGSPYSTSYGRSYVMDNL